MTEIAAVEAADVARRTSGGHGRRLRGRVVVERIRQDEDGHRHRLGMRGTLGRKRETYPERGHPHAEVWDCTCACGGGR